MRAIMAKSFLAQFCLAFHLYAGLLRYCEAVEIIRDLFDSFDHEDEVCDSEEPSTDDGSEGCQNQPSSVSEGPDHDEADFAMAMPVEQEDVPPTSAFRKRKGQHNSPHLCVRFDQD